MTNITPGYKSNDLRSHADTGNPLGILLIAYGKDRYLKQAETLAISLKTNMPGTPIALVTNADHPESKWFDLLIPVDHSRGGGMLQKLYLDLYSPFDETLYIDSDCISSRSFLEELSEIRAYDFSPVCETWLNPSQEDDYIDSLSVALGKVGADAFPKFNGGLFFFKKNVSGSRVFERARELLLRQRELGIRDFDRNGPNDETIYSLALASLHLTNLYDDRGRLMRPTVAMSGRVRISPLGGGCSFTMYGRIVEPAICHFVRDGVLTWPYLKSYWILHRNIGQLRSLKEILNFGCHSIRSTCILSTKFVRNFLRTSLRFHNKNL